MNNNYTQLMNLVNEVAVDYKLMTGDAVEIEVVEGTITDEQGGKVSIIVGTIQIGGHVVEMDRITVSKKNVDELDAEGLRKSMENVVDRFAEVQKFYSNIDTHRMSFITSGIKQYDNILEAFNRVRAHALEISTPDAMEYLDTADNAMEALGNLYSFIKANLVNIYFGQEDIAYKRPWKIESREEVRFNELLQIAKDSRSGELAIGLISAMEEI